MSNNSSITLKDVQDWDRSDPMARYRDEFALPDEIIYLDGNSLGALPKRVKKRVQETTEMQWGHDLIGSWNTHGWVDLPSQVGHKIARLIGAAADAEKPNAPQQVVCCDSISVNVFKLLGAAISYNGTTTRNCILSSHDNFPTDLYIAQGMETLLGKERCQFVDVAEEDLMNSMNETTAVIMVTEVNFRSGKRLDIKALTEKAHACGALILVDLAHSAGAMPIHLDEWDVDMAVGCTYKYLNGGPGAPAFVYVNKRLHDKVQQPVAGWFGHNRPFAFDAKYQPDRTVKQFLAGSPPIISMAAVDSALDVFENINLSEVRTKSMQLTQLFHDLIEQDSMLSEKLGMLSPKEASARGSQLCYSFDYAYELCQALIARGVIADFRAPHFIRFGFAPLYIRYQDVWNAVDHIRLVIITEDYKDPRWAKRNAVT